MMVNESVMYKLVIARQLNFVLVSINIYLNISELKIYFSQGSRQWADSPIPLHGIYDTANAADSANSTIEYRETSHEEQLMPDKVVLSMDEIMERLQSFSFPDVDLVVGITSGAKYPARMIANLLNLPVRYIHINYRSTDNTPKYKNPKLIQVEDIPSHYNRILLVDDVSVSGKTLKCAVGNLQKFIVRTFVLKGKAEYVLFPEITTCVDWPWHKENQT
jgi:hypoxanthine phosphoribosyltransferase